MYFFFNIFDINEVKHYYSIFSIKIYLKIKKKKKKFLMTVYNGITVQKGAMNNDDSLFIDFTKLKYMYM